MPKTRNRKFKDLVGQKFGKWTVLEHLGIRGKSRNRLWKCRCDCGTIKEVWGNQLGVRSNSCGCHRQSEEFSAKVVERNTTHGMSGTKIWWIWQAMLDRCRNPNNKAWKNYGGRGIKVCKRWQKFENFYADMGKPPKGLTLERVNNNRGYSPSNCKWATRKEQRANQRPCQKV